jgi:competence protein ComEC
MKVLQFPLARITIGFVLGILVAFYLKPELTTIFGLLLVSLLFLGISYFVQKNTFGNTIYFGLATYIASLFVGLTTQIVHTDYYQKSNYTHEKNFFEKPHLLSIVIREKLKSTNFNDRYIAVINHVDAEKCTGKILLNVKKHSFNHEFEIGTSLQIKGIAYKNKQRNNPNQFDYSAYLEKKQIYAQLFTNKESISIGSKYKKDIWYYSSKIRTTIIQNLQKRNFNSTELNVAIALIMGQKQDVSPEIIQDYQYAGAVHILSVSGLHVGFILLFISFLLKPIPNTPNGSFIKLTLILASLFSFALIAGLAPSVVRSVTMFSFVAIGQHLRRSVNIYHTILVSVFLILLFQPSFLFDVGFQLSYIALFFIIWFQPLLASIWSPKAKAFEYMWGILTVSFAAQIGTLPLSIYYFHQFPGLFFITNLAIIPLLSIIMILGVLVMVLAGFNFVPLFLSKPLEWGIYLLNKIINTIASYEQFIIHDIPFNIYLMASSYLVILTAIIWFKKPSYSKLIILLISIMTIQFSYIKTQWDSKNQKEWIVFNFKKNTMVIARDGKDVVLYARENLLKTAKSNSVLNSYLVANFSKLKGKEKIKNTAFFKDNRILILDSLGNYPKDVQVDVIVITQSPRINMDRMLHLLKPKIVVADVSNFKILQKFWKASCEKQKIPFHAVAEKGFFKLN